MNDDERTTRRDVRSEEPSLSPEANRILTDELRKAVGSDTVEVPADRPRRSREAAGGRSGPTVLLATHRLAVGITFFAALVVGGIVALATGSWWLLLVPIALHAVGTLAVAALALELTTKTEHASPEATARLEQEGVADPDALLTDLVDELAPEDSEARRQQRAVTPDSDDSEPVGP